MTTKAVGDRRLLKLAGILDVADALHRKRKEPGYCQERYNHECGSPACALGHAYSDRGFRRAGLKNPDWSFVVEDAEFFSITVAEAQELFDTDGCGSARTAKQAAKYIRAFVKRRT
jgi:hypothetical protein